MNVIKQAFQDKCQGHKNFWYVLLIAKSSRIGLLGHIFYIKTSSSCRTYILYKNKFK